MQGRFSSSSSTSTDHVLEDVERSGHLREDEHATALRVESRQQLVEDRHLPARVDEVLAELGQGAILHAFEQVGMVGGLKKKGDGGEQTAEPIEPQSPPPAHTPIHT